MSEEQAEEPLWGRGELMNLLGPLLRLTVECNVRLIVLQCC